MLQLSAEDQRVWTVIGVIALLVLLFIPFSQIVLNVNYTYTVRTVAMGGLYWVLSVACWGVLQFCARRA